MRAIASTDKGFTESIDEGVIESTEIKSLSREKWFVLYCCSVRKGSRSLMLLLSKSL